MKINVKKQRLELDGDTVAEGALNYAAFELYCDDSWKGFNKTVRFAAEDGIYDVPDIEEGKAYYIPHEVLREGRVWVGVVGVAEDNRVATTEKTWFDVKGAIASGNTPTVTRDAYAVFVNEALQHRRAAKESESAVLDCLEKCRELTEEVKRLSRIAVGSARRCDSVREEVHGMMSAVGMAFRDIKEAEKTIASVNSKYTAEEMRRDKGERARAYSESKRGEKEEERRQRETEREAAEIRRSTAEQVRAFNDARRESQLKDMEERIFTMENAVPQPLTHLHSVEAGEGELRLDDFTEAESITLYGKVTEKDGKLHGAGEGGFLTFTSDGEEMSLPLSQPLYSVGDVEDSVTLSSRGEVTVTRRTERLCIDGTESYVCEDTDDGVICITALTGKAPLYGNCTVVSSFTELCSDIFINGDHLFFCLDGNNCHDIPTFTEELKKRPIELIYPILTPVEEREGSVGIVTMPHLIGYNGKISASCKKDIFKALEMLNEKIKQIEKENKNENT